MNVASSHSHFLLPIFFLEVNSMFSSTVSLLRSYKLILNFGIENFSLLKIIGGKTNCLYKQNVSYRIVYLTMLLVR